MLMKRIDSLHYCIIALSLLLRALAPRTHSGWVRRSPYDKGFQVLKGYRGRLALRESVTQTLFNTFLWPKQTSILFP